MGAKEWRAAPVAALFGIGLLLLCALYRNGPTVHTIRTRRLSCYPTPYKDRKTAAFG